MNDNQRQIRPAFHGIRLNQLRPGNSNARHFRPHVHIERARPPSFSRAPWDVTLWVDPIQNPKATEATKN